MIDVIRHDGLIQKAEQTGAVMADMLAELVERHPSIGEVRSIGLFGALELVRNRDTREPLSPFNQTNSTMKRFRQYLMEHGVFLYTHWHTALIIPPLIITPEQLAEGFAVIDRALEITDRETDGA